VAEMTIATAASGISKDFTISFSTVRKLNKKRYAAHRDSPFELHHQ
jgi:hypothetical protein